MMGALTASKTEIFVEVEFWGMPRGVIEGLIACCQQGVPDSGLRYGTRKEA